MGTRIMELKGAGQIDAASNVRIAAIRADVYNVGLAQVIVNFASAIEGQKVRCGSETLKALDRLFAASITVASAADRERNENLPAEVKTVADMHNIAERMMGYSQRHTAST